MLQEPGLFASRNRARLHLLWPGRLASARLVVIGCAASPTSVIAPCPQQERGLQSYTSRCTNALASVAAMMASIGSCQLWQSACNATFSRLPPPAGPLSLDPSLGQPDRPKLTPTSLGFKELALTEKRMLERSNTSYAGIGRIAQGANNRVNAICPNEQIPLCFASIGELYRNAIPVLPEARTSGLEGDRIGGLHQPAVECCPVDGKRANPNTAREMSNGCSDKILPVGV